MSLSVKDTNFLTCSLTRMFFAPLLCRSAKNTGYASVEPVEKVISTTN